MQYILCNGAQEILFLTQKGTFLGRTSQKNHPVYIVHLAELNLQICNYAQKRHIYREIVNKCLAKNL